MAFQRDESGQVMLTGAFLFAAIIVIIAIMLNNLIFSNNVAYLGFMEQSKYDELSIKHMTVDEAASAFVESNGQFDPLFKNHMNDYCNTLNSITIQKGKFIDINPLSTYGSIPGSNTLSVARTELSIYSKDASKSYLVTTNYVQPTAASLPAARTPGNVIVKLGSNTSELSINPLGCALLVVEVINNSTFMPEPGVTVKLTAVSGHMSWRTSGDDVSMVNPFQVVTDYNGKAFVFYDPPGVVGQQIINASVGTNPIRAYKNLSNNVSITVLGTLVSPGACTAHPVDIGNLAQSYSHSQSSDWVTGTIHVHITAPYDFWGNNPRFTVTLTLSNENNLQLISHSSQYLQEISDNHVEATLMTMMKMSG
jgi:hypothetical protein